MSKKIQRDKFGKFASHNYVDMVNNPPHYKKHPSGIECIDITEHMNFNLGNAVKYIWRVDDNDKGGIESLEKAVFYINREIQRRNNERNK